MNAKSKKLRVGDVVGGGPPKNAHHFLGEETTAGPTRGYLKLAGAARAFDFDFRGKTVLDIGSSTGGFTEYALDHGAAKVIAVEKGTNQMKSPLRHDPRVELYEKTDVFRAGISTFGGITERGSASISALAPWRPPLGTRTSSARRARATRPPEVLIPTPDVVLADVSFISLTKVLNYAIIHLTRPNTQFLVMLKPQFEARPEELNNGVVKNEHIRRDIIKRFEQWLKQNGLVIIKKRDNTLAGKNGNVERFYWLKRESK